MLMVGGAQLAVRHGNREDQLVVGGSAGHAQDVVTCNFTSYVPIRHVSAGTISGEGVIDTCTPHQPQTCKITADIQWFDKPSDAWVTYAGGTGQYGPPCDGLSDTTTAACKASFEVTEYRTETILAVVEDGVSGTKDNDSDGQGYSHCP